MNAHFGQVMKAEAVSRDEGFERSSYRRSRRSDPIVSLCALGIGLTTLAAFAFMNPVFVKKQKHEATVIALLELPDDPPPAAETPPPPQQDLPPPQPAIAAPVPVVALNVTPVIAAPAPAPQPAPPAPKAAPPASTAIIAKGPENVGDMSAQVVFRRPIRVPFESRRAHEEGVVILSILLGTDGRVSDISIASSSGFPRLDRAALESVRDWRWSPLIRSGNPVMVRGNVRIPFIRERGGPGGRGDRDGPHDHRGPRGDRDDGPRGDRHGDGPRPDDRT